MMDGLTLSDIGLSETQIQRFVDLPEEWSPEHAVARGGKVVDPTVAYLGPGVREKEKAGTISRRELIWASAYRSMCRAKDGDLPSSSGRLSKSKPEVRASYLGPRASVGGTATPVESVDGVVEEALEEEDVLDGFEEPDGEGEVEGDEENLDTGLVGQYDGTMDMDMQMDAEGGAAPDYVDGDEDLDRMEER